MRIHKYVFLLTLTLTIISLLSVFYLHYFVNNSAEVEFWINILLALFGGGFLSMLVALFEYFNVKSIYLKRLYNKLFDIENNVVDLVFLRHKELYGLILKYKNCWNWDTEIRKKYITQIKNLLDDENNDILDQDIEEVLDKFDKDLKNVIQKYLKIDYKNIEELIEIFDNLDFIFGNIKFRKWIKKNICDYLINICDQIKENEITFYNFLNKKEQNYVAIYYYITNIQKNIFKVKIEDTQFSTVYYIYNNLYDSLKFKREILRAKIYHKKRKVIKVFPLMTDTIYK